MQDTFADIRPYGDHEVAAVLQRLLVSKELQQALQSFFYPKYPQWLQSWLAPLWFYKARKKLTRITSVEEFQHWLAYILKALLARTTENIEVRGLTQLPSGVPYLWISNHRDIAMDPLLVNYSLFTHAWPTSRIAIGDNLLSHPDVADIMRLNKSFIVKRNIANRREKLLELKKLSAYIRHSLNEQHSIWIAQREGRAKDGRDLTDTAVLKMLALHGREQAEDFTQTMQQLNPVPVNIQYEWDPCDIFKARELVALATTGQYQKTTDEDTRSILSGITGAKGKVLVSFGKPLSAEELASPDSMAAAIDQQLKGMAEIWPVQRTALALLQRDFQGYEHYQGAQWHSELAADLRQRFQHETQAVQERALQTYAAPLLG